MTMEESRVSPKIDQTKSSMKCRRAIEKSIIAPHGPSLSVTHARLGPRSTLRQLFAIFCDKVGESLNWHEITS